MSGGAYVNHTGSIRGGFTDFFLFAFCTLARRGLIMGLWNSHTSVGNILGSLIAGYWVSSNWGMSFIVPGLLIAAMGVVCFLFLIERKFNHLNSWRK